MEGVTSRSNVERSKAVATHSLRFQEAPDGVIRQGSQVPQVHQAPANPKVAGALTQTSVRRGAQHLFIDLTPLRRAMRS
jgi:hypothetical protein